MSTKQPTLIAYSVKPREGKQDFFRRIGAAFPHEKGTGLTILLDALPLGDRIVLREPKDESKADNEGDAHDAPHEKAA